MLVAFIWSFFKLSESLEAFASWPRITYTEHARRKTVTVRQPSAGLGDFFFFRQVKGKPQTYTPGRLTWNLRIHPWNFGKSSSKWDDFQVLMLIFRGVNDCDHPFWSLSGDKGNMFEGMAHGEEWTPLRALGPEIGVNWRDFHGAMVLPQEESFDSLDYRLIYDFLSEDFVSVGFPAIFVFSLKRPLFEISKALLKQQFRPGKEKSPSCENPLRPWTLSMLWNARDAPSMDLGDERHILLRKRFKIWGLCRHVVPEVMGLAILLEHEITWNHYEVLTKAQF